MAIVRSEASAVIPASPDRVYQILADYHREHPAILPKPYFSDIVVEQGGQGAGTIFRVKISMLGSATEYHMTVTEPQPGRMIVETDDALGVVTTFAIASLENPQQTRLTITTDSPAKTGFQGRIENWLTPLVGRYLYNKELKQLAAYVQSKATNPAS